MKKNLLIFAVVFLIAFLWGLFFTYGFHFFWEDFGVYHLDKEIYPLNQQQPGMLSSLGKIFIGFIRNAFSVKRLFQVSFSGSFTDRPYAFLTWDFLTIIFGDKVALYRIFKAAVFALNACFIFLIINRASRFLALSGILLYISSPYQWLSLVYSCDIGMYSQFAMLVTILLFLKLTENKPVNWRQVWFYYILIFIASNYSVLAKWDGRYLAVIFLLTVIFFRRSEFRLHAPILFIILLTEIPVLGYLKKILTNANFYPINLISHNDLSMNESLKFIFQNRRFALDAIGQLLLLVFLLSMITLITHLLFRKSAVLSNKIRPLDPALKERSFLFMLWFISSVIMIAAARSLRYDGPRDLQLLDFQYLVAPFIIFLSYYIALIGKGFVKPYRYVFWVACLGLIILHILASNLRLLNQFRGGWGNYFCAWRNAEKYIEKTCDNALALSVNAMIYKPFVFRHSNNKVMNTVPPAEKSPFCNLNYIERQFRDGRYNDIFVLGWGKLQFRESSDRIELKEVKVIDGDSGDLYDRMKKVLGRPSKPQVYVYWFRRSGEN